MNKIIENKKFKHTIFKTESGVLEVKEPYLSNDNFTNKEIKNFIKENGKNQKTNKV